MLQPIILGQEAGDFLCPRQSGKRLPIRLDIIR